MVILNAKVPGYRCIAWNVSRSGSNNILNNSVLDGKCSLEVLPYKTWTFVRINYLLK